MSLARGPVFQLCWVVSDVAAATEEFTARYGVTEWFTMPDIRFTPDTCVYRGAPADYSATVALGYAGGQQLELIQPLRGPGPYADFLERHGPGLHHVAWVVDDLAAAVARARADGARILAEGVFEGAGMAFAYLDGGPLGSCVELLELSARMRSVFDGLVPEGHSNPWG